MLRTTTGPDTEGVFALSRVAIVPRPLDTSLVAVFTVREEDADGRVVPSRSPGHASVAAGYWPYRLVGSCPIGGDPGGRISDGFARERFGCLRRREAAAHGAITKAFYLGVTEVTQEQYERVMGSNPSSFKGAQLPVEQVSWEDACRARSTTKWSFGDSESSLGDYAWYWYRDNAGSKANPVGQKKPNAWGLYDMHGNVREWCSDWFGDYASTTVSDPTGPATGSSRVFRGGCWDLNAGYCRSAGRYRGSPDIRSLYLGFRLAFSSVDQSGR